MDDVLTPRIGNNKLVAKVYSKTGIYPTRKSAKAGAYDVHLPDSLVLEPSETSTVPTGLIIECPKGYDYRVRVRSSVAAQGVIMTTGVGLIDEDYCGAEDELHFILHNLSKERVIFERFARVGQINFVKKPPEIVFQSEPLSYFEDNETRGGIGSTGS